jgi:cell division protein ZapA (FtsZ GTPase activity inhibitor)
MISEQTQERCLQRLTGKIRSIEGLSAEMFHQAIDHHAHEHSERYLLALVYGQLRDHDLLSVRTEAEKYLMLAALNLVDCIAATSQMGDSHTHP